MAELTTEQVRTAFLDCIRLRAHYWATLPAEQNRSGQPDTAWRVWGMAFSILAILDGCTDLPGFIVAPAPHPDDKAFHQAESSDWFPENHDLEVKADIAGCLHELLGG